MRGCWVPVIAAVSVAFGHAQTNPGEIQPTFQNLNFTAGAPGGAPPGWLLGPEWFMSPHAQAYKAEVTAGTLCLSGAQCGEVSSVRQGPSVPLAFLYQDVSAKPYWGKLLTFRAAVRADVALGSVARLLVRIHQMDGSTSFRDDMGNTPITSGAWSFYQIVAPIVSNARDIEFGMQLVGPGAAWIDNISMTFVDREHLYDVRGKVPKNDADAIRLLIHRFADSRNAHDGSAAAQTYTEDGEYVSAGGGTRTKGRAALAVLWGSVQGSVQRTLEFVDLAAPDIAIARVVAEFDGAAKLSETFILVRRDGQWKIQIHEALNYARQTR